MTKDLIPASELPFNLTAETIPDPERIQADLDRKRDDAEKAARAQLDMFAETDEKAPSGPVRAISYQMGTVTLPVVKESSGERLSMPCDVHKYCADLGDLAQESFHVVTLNAQNEIIDRHMVTLGLVDASLVHPREVFRPAITDGACAVILVHNHPSGDPSPSAEDINVTKRLIDAGKVLDIDVHDHIVIGRGERPFVSMRERGVAKF